MVKIRIVVCILVCSLSGLLGIGLAHGQAYPKWNGGTVANDNPPPTGGPTHLVIQMPGGSTVTLNGLEPGAQVNLVLVQGTASWTSDQTQTLVSAVSTGISQSWPGVPYVDYPPPASQVTDDIPTINQVTGFQGATTENVISAVVAVTQTDLDGICGAGNGGCTADTFDPSTGYVTSSLTYISSNYQNSIVEEHEVVGHGEDNLTDCTSCNSLMAATAGQQAPGFTSSDLQTIYSDVTNPVPSSLPPCSDPCDDSSCAGYTCDACGTNCGGGCSNDDGCGGGLVCMGGSCGCSDPCDDSSCDGYNCANCGVNCGCSAAMPASSGAIGNIDCDNPCDMDCSNYDPDQCATGGRASNDGLTLKRMPVLRETWLPSGLALAFVLPVVFRVRRRKAGDKPSKEQKNDIQ